jgi:hypothetical protein
MPNNAHVCQMNNLYSTWIFSIIIQHFNVKYDNNAYSTFEAYLRNLMLICAFGCQINNLSFDTRKLNLTCLCQYAECVWMSNEQLVHSTWIFYPCPFDMFWLLTRCQINKSNEHHFCIFAKRVALLVIALFKWQRLPKIEF